MTDDLDDFDGICRPEDIEILLAYQDATEKWLDSADSTGWMGGDFNMCLMVDKLRELGLMNVEDKVAALSAAYRSLRDDGVLVEPEDIEDDDDDAI